MNRLKELREKSNYTLDDIEKLTGIKRGTYSNYENGNTEPKLEIWQKLADYFDVSVPYLQGISPTKEQDDCPYCHMETIMTGAAGELEVQMPEKHIHQYESTDFSIDIYVSNTSQLMAEIEDREGEYISCPKIKFCPMCGRKLGD